MSTTTYTVRPATKGTVFVGRMKPLAEAVPLRTARKIVTGTQAALMRVAEDVLWGRKEAA